MLVDYSNVMDEVLPSSPEVAEIKAAHGMRRLWETDRIKAVVLLGKGWTGGGSGRFVTLRARCGATVEYDNKKLTEYRHRVPAS
jgi:hypothetical protein